MKNVALVIALSAALIGASDLQAAEEEPAPLLPEVVAAAKLLPLLPDGPAGWTADKPEGSTEDAGGVKITTVHRDYKKGDADTAPSLRSAFSIRPPTRSMSKTRRAVGLSTLHQKVIQGPPDRWHAGFETSRTKENTAPSG